MPNHKAKSKDSRGQRKPLPRLTESLLRQLLEFPEEPDSGEPEELLNRFRHLQRALAPEHEFSLILSWLGRCRFVHRLVQEQLPLASTQQYRVPDLIADFDYAGRDIPTLIEIKVTGSAGGAWRPNAKLSIKPHQFRYAEVLDMPLLVAWRNGAAWTLFEAKRARLAAKNYKIDFKTAMKENLMGELAGDFAYRLAPGSAIRLTIAKLGPPDSETGHIEGVVRKACFTNPAGEEVPNIPLLANLFLMWDDDVTIEDKGNEVIQTFLIQDTEEIDFASSTFSRMVYTLADLASDEVRWLKIIHNPNHWAHDADRLRRLLSEGAKQGFIQPVMVQRPVTTPLFLQNAPGG